MYVNERRQSNRRNIKRIMSEMRQHVTIAAWCPVAQEHELTRFNAAAISVASR